MPILNLNPLEIGSNCNGSRCSYRSWFSIGISIPLKSGLIVMVYDFMNQMAFRMISIPLKSGLIVIVTELNKKGTKNDYLNPLEIGSNCNIKRYMEKKLL